MLQWCYVISVIVASLSMLVWLLPIPAINTKFRDEPCKFVYRVAVMCILVWYDSFVMLVIVLTAYIPSLGEEDHESELYTISASVAACFVAVMIVVIGMEELCCKYACCCCCKPGGCCTATGCAKNIVARFCPTGSAAAAGSSSFQRQVITHLVAFVTSGILTPIFTSELSTTKAIGPGIAIYLVVTIIGVCVYDKIATIVIAVEFSLVVSAAAVLSVLYLIQLNWANRETREYTSAFIFVVCLTFIHIAYDSLLCGDRELWCGRNIGRGKPVLVPTSDTEEETGETRKAGDPRLCKATNL